MLNPKEKLGYSNSIPARDYAIYSGGPQLIREIEKEMHNESLHGIGGKLPRLPVSSRVGREMR